MPLKELIKSTKTFSVTGPSHTTPPTPAPSSQRKNRKKLCLIKVEVFFLVVLTLGRTSGGVRGVPTPHKVFRSFFLENKTIAPDVFSSCLFIPRAHFEASLVMVSCYGYKI